MIRRAALAATLALTPALAACGDEHTTPIDAPRATDAATDAAAIDAATDDASTDAPADATDAAAADAADAAPDAGVDAAVDAATDATAIDAPTDGASVDARPGPVVIAMSPQNGLATATTTGVRLIGYDLVPGTMVYFNNVPGIDCTYPSTDDSLIICSVPPGPVGRGPIFVFNPNGNFTGVPGWAFTGVDNETDTPREVDYCNLQHPLTMTAPIGGSTPFVYGRIYEAGLTEAAGAPTGVRAEVGWGPAGTSPLTDGRWRFFAAGWNLQVGNDDEFYGAFLGPGPATTFSYTFRFSFDDGLHYTYCDLDGAGSNPGLTFSPTQLGVLTTTN